MNYNTVNNWNKIVDPTWGFDTARRELYSHIQEQYPLLEEDKTHDMVEYLIDNWSLTIAELNKQRRTWKEFAEQKLYAWDFSLSDGDSIKDKTFDLFNKVSVLCVRSETNKILANISCNKELCAALTVSAVQNNIEFIIKYEKLENARMWAGQVKRSCGNNGYCTDFDLYEDLQLTKDEIVICIGNQTSVLKVFNYPFVE